VLLREALKGLRPQAPRAIGPRAAAGPSTPCVCRRDPRARSTPRSAPQVDDLRARLGRAGRRSGIGGAARDHVATSSQGCAEQSHRRGKPSPSIWPDAARLRIQVPPSVGTDGPGGQQASGETPDPRARERVTAHPTGPSGSCASPRPRPPIDVGAARRTNPTQEARGAGPASRTSTGAFRQRLPISADVVDAKEKDSRPVSSRRDESPSSMLGISNGRRWLTNRTQEPRTDQQLRLCSMDVQTSAPGSAIALVEFSSSVVEVTPAPAEDLAQPSPFPRGRCGVFGLRETVGLRCRGLIGCCRTGVSGSRR
jgi:hypothetical protein